ncbi:MAG: hypothetical protein JW834_02235 [Candidatus Diapherotrites archaeon]|nr:hypothetical protein [Candidatus Diapherotrites archaeon]
MLGERAQASLEYLYLTAFVIGLAAVTALLVQDILAIQNQAKNKICTYRAFVLSKIVAEPVPC